MIPFDGRLERRGASPVLMALLVLLVAFVLFQVIISPIALLVLLLARGISPSDLLANMEQVFADEPQTVLLANTVGQILGIGLVAVVFARGHSSRPWAFLRVRSVDAAAMGLTVLGLIALFPIAQWLGILNEMLPLPDWLNELEQSQTALLEKVLLQESAFLFNLAVLALTPAICEELLFRGYVQRQAERGLGATGGILLSGILFGLYHLRLSQVIPLTLVGLYLAFVAWRFRSIWPAVVAHFLFNGFAVAASAFFTPEDAGNVEDVEKIGVPWYLLLTGTVLLIAVLSKMLRLRND